MSMMLLLLTKFDTTDLHDGGTIRQFSVDATGKKAVVNILHLSNGTKYDVDGTAVGLTTWGSMHAVFRITTTTHGGVHVMSQSLQGLLNKRATLRGIMYSNTETVPQVCDARCTLARPIWRQGLTAQPGIRTHQVDIEMAWEIFSGWVYP